ncbi:F-box protein CPR1 [Glycine max]|nr:F-box protein CPR1 [Glycine max]
MKEYKVQTSWTKSFVMSTNYYPFLYCFEPICFTKTGEVFGSGGHDRLLRLNKKMKREVTHPQTLPDELIHEILLRFKTDDYVVAILQLSLDQDLPSYPKVDFFSSRTNSWSRIEGTLPCYFSGQKNVRHKFVHKFMHMFLNGALHWMIESYNDLGLIIEFDVRERRLSDIPLSRYLTIEWEYKLHHLTVMEGLVCLCLSDYMDDLGTTEIWTMKEYKVQESWTKLFVLPNNSYHCLPLFVLIRFIKTGEILGSNGANILLLRPYNKGEEGLQLCARGQTHFSLTCMYRESLLSLPVEF